MAMQDPKTGDFLIAEDSKALESARAEMIAELDGDDPLRDKRGWPIFRVGKLVVVENSDGEGAVCVVESIGKKFLRLRGVPRAVIQAEADRARGATA